MHSKQTIIIICIALTLLLSGQPMLAAPVAQDDPAELCREGVELAENGQYDEALPLLEAGFISRENGNFAKLDDKAICAAVLGYLWNNRSNYTKALEVFEVALEVVRDVGNRKGEGTILINIGTVYEAQGEYEEALAQFEQALTILQEIGDQAGVGTTLNNIGVVYEAQGEYKAALAQHEQALAIKRKINDWAGVGTTLNNIGVVYEAQGEYKAALAQHEQALAIKRKINDWAGVGTTLNNIGEIYRSQGEYEAALAQYEQALAIRREVGDRAGEGTTLNNIGIVYYSQGNYEAALTQYEQALTIWRKIGDRVGVGDTLNNIGGVYWSQGKYEAALIQFEQALALKQKIGARVGEGVILNSIGVVYEAQGKYEAALAQFEQALTIRQEVGDRIGEGATLHNIGALYGRLGKYEAALAQFEQALTISREINDRTGEGTTLNTIGGVYHSLENPEAALVQYEQALTIRREIGDRAGQGTTLNNIGVILSYFEGKYEEALVRYKQALTIHRETGNLEGEGISLYNIGFVYEKQEKYEAALAQFEQTMNVFEMIRATAGSDQTRSSYIAQRFFIFNKAINLYQKNNHSKEAFFTAERNRARSFMDALTTGHVQLDDSDMVALYNQEQSLYSQRQAVQDNLAQAKTREDTDLISDLETQLAELEEQYAAIQADIEARGDQLSDLVPGRTSDNLLTVEQVQPYLAADSTLVMYHVLEENVLVFLLTPTSFETVMLEISPDELKQTISQFRSFANVDDPHPAPLVQLYDWLIAPLKDKLTTPHLTIIPHQTLHYLPFAALTDGQHYLVDEYTLTTLPSASVLPYILKNAQSSDDSAKSVLVMGNPTTGAYDATASLATTRDGFRSLKYAETEAEAIADLYGVEPLLKEQATETALRQQAEQAKIIHLAAHGKYNPVAPLSSLIALAPDEENDGWLTVGEVFGLPLEQTELVVLSACESHVGGKGLRTGLGVSAGDDIVGLNRAFIFAGAPSIMSSLWPVEDESTSLLMTEFYSNLHNGMGKAAALRQAQLTVREQYPNPYYWAAFVLAGDGDINGQQPSETTTESGWVDWLYCSTVGCD